MLTLTKLSQKFGQTTVLDNLDLQISENEVFGLIGFSGSGKTTLLRDIMGFHVPTSGSILYKGKDITKDNRFLKSKVGFTTQSNSFYFRLTVYENLQFFGRMYNVPSAELDKRIDELLKLVRLSDHKHTLSSKLSGGMQRRLDFAISLIHDPEILILDEPTTGLDPIIRGEIWQLINYIHSMGKTIIIASHLFDEIEAYCSRIGIMKSGKILCAGTLAELQKKFGTKSLTEIFRRTQ